MKADGMFLNRDRGKMEWLFGDSKLVTGVLTWLFLICIIFVIRKIYSGTMNIDQEKNSL
jgi:hypothetical protein